MTIQQQFCNDLYPHIVRECQSRGYKYPVAILAQAAKESNWGQSELSRKYYNFFGMKAGASWAGVKVDMKTKEEYTAGNLTTVNASWRVYGDIASGISGYFDFISTKRYSNLKDATSEVNYFELLREDGYFTSSTYVSTIQKWLDACHLFLGQPITNGEDEKETTVIKYDGLIGVLDDLVDYIVGEVINKKYGNGDDRKRALGEYYTLIQDKVNRRLKNGV